MFYLGFFNAVGMVLAAIAMHSFVKAVYNLYFHPLRHFPGPKIAAIGTLYEFYHDVILDGLYLWKIKEMHRHYGWGHVPLQYPTADQYYKGPIVRVSPEELHICDSSFYSDIYAGGGRKVNKSPEAVAAFTVPRASLATVDHDLHRLRRGILGPYFSKRSVVRLEPLIMERVERLCARLNDLCQLETPINLDAAFAALTADVITQYFYGSNSDYLGHTDFVFKVREGILGLIGYYHLTRFFPALATGLKKLPIPILRRIQPGAADLLVTQEDIRKKITTILAEGKEKASQGVILDAFLNADVPGDEKSIDRLQDEGATIIFAGTETTARALSIMMFHILNDKRHVRRLRNEMSECGFFSDRMLASTELEKLPYLRGVVQEGLRLSHGPLIRLPRVATHESLTYGGYSIPPGTPVSQSTYFVHMDPLIFPEPLKFRPDRWVQAADAGVKLDNFIVSFTKGSRQCLGISLAYAEMYLTIATIVQRFDMDLFETTDDDVGIHHIRLTGYPKGRTGEVRVVARRFVPGSDLQRARIPQ